MCIPCKKKRKKQKATSEKAKSSDPVDLEEDCPYASSSSESSEVEEVEPKLISLTVIDATHIAGERHWAVRSDVNTVTVRAVTEPNDESAWNELDWTGASAVSPNKRDATVDIGIVKDVVVKAELDVEKQVTIEIYDLISNTCPLPGGKGYKSDDGTTRLKAVASPDVAKVWNLLVWGEGAPTAAKNECDVDLKPVGSREVSVKLGEREVKAPVKICQWPKLAIEEITFNSHTIYNDGVGEVKKKFDKKWKKGRKDPKAGRKAKSSQSPLCFTRHKKIKLSAKFKIDPAEKATEDENVKIEADLGFGKIEGTVAVSAGADEATLALTESSAKLPNVVGAEPAWEITWKSRDSADAAWREAGKSKHIRYEVLGKPKSKLYFTLLHISCDAAKGKSTADDLVAESFKPYAAATGTGKGFQRKGDDKRLSYYLNGWKTVNGFDAQTTEGLLGSADATGRCGGYATLLIHMWDMHGVASAQRWYIRARDKDYHNPNLRFIVKNCTFNAGTRVNSAYTHEGDPVKTEVVKIDGIAGHGQTNPQFDFGDHVVVKYGGKLYDPSYGVGPYDTDKLYLEDALCGLGVWPQMNFTHKTIPQHMPTECVPYADGFTEYTIILEPLEFCANEFDMTGAEVLLHGAFDIVNSSKTAILTPAVPSDVTPGMHVRIHLGSGNYMWKTMVDYFTLSDIAALHPKTEDEIFDHAKNAHVKALRTNKAGLKTNDTIVVAKDLDPDGWLVFGHDL